jgi:phospholipid transport system substrate-binding protein
MDRRKQMMLTNSFPRLFLPALLLPVLVLLSLLAAPLPAGAASCPAAGFVQRAGQAYDRAGGSKPPAAFASATSRLTDLRELSLFALGRYRKQLPKAREQEYLALTRAFIGTFMLENGKGFRASDLAITGCAPSGGGYIVHASLSTGGKVIFRVARTGGGYTIKDVNMKGIWLAQQLRSTFVGTISRTGSIDGLFSYLKS